MLLGRTSSGSSPSGFCSEECNDPRALGRIGDGVACMLGSLIEGLRRGGRQRQIVAQSTAALAVGGVGEALRLLQPARDEAPSDARVSTLLAEALIAADRL